MSPVNKYPAVMRVLVGGLSALLLALLTPISESDQALRSGPNVVRTVRTGPQRLDSADTAVHGFDDLAPAVGPQSDQCGSLAVSGPATPGSTAAAVVTPAGPAIAPDLTGRLVARPVVVTSLLDPPRPTGPARAPPLA